MKNFIIYFALKKIMRLLVSYNKENAENFKTFFLTTYKIDSFYRCD